MGRLNSLNRSNKEFRNSRVKKKINSRIGDKYVCVKFKDSLEAEEYFNKKWEEQNGECAVCHKHETHFKRRLCIDHDHLTGEPRGLLCSKCNSALGYVDECEDIAFGLLRYIRDITGNKPR